MPTCVMKTNLQPDLNGNPFFCKGNCVGKKDWEWKAEMSAIKKYKVTFDAVKCLPK